MGKTIKSIFRIFLICVVVYVILKLFGFDPIKPILFALEKFVEYVVRVGDWLAGSKELQNAVR